MVLVSVNMYRNLDVICCCTAVVKDNWSMMIDKNSLYIVHCVINMKQPIYIIVVLNENFTLLLLILCLHCMHAKICEFECQCNVTSCAFKFWLKEKSYTKKKPNDEI